MASDSSTSFAPPLPSTMRAWQVAERGTDPANGRIARPDPGPGEVLIQVAACGLNFADLLQIDGRYQVRATPPYTPGMELAGRVVAHGQGVLSPAIGARVAVLTDAGGLAEYAIAPADRCLPLPDAMDWVTAAAFQIAYGTSLLALDRRGRLKAGETLVVTGAAGGVGLTAVAIGRRMGARVIAVARGADRLAVAAKAGAEMLIDSAEAGLDLKARLKALGGADVIYDTVGGEMALGALGALRPEGRFLVIGFAGGDVPQFPANLMLVKNIEAIGVYFGGYQSFAPDVLTGVLAQLLDWQGAGALDPHVSHLLPFEAAGEGFTLLRERRATGKIVVTVGGDIGGV